MEGFKKNKIIPFKEQVGEKVSLKTERDLPRDLQSSSYYSYSSHSDDNTKYYSYYYSTYYSSSLPPLE